MFCNLPHFQSEDCYNLKMVHRSQAPHFQNCKIVKPFSWESPPHVEKILTSSSKLLEVIFFIPGTAKSVQSRARTKTCNFQVRSKNSREKSNFWISRQILKGMNQQSCLTHRISTYLRCWNRRFHIMCFPSGGHRPSQKRGQRVSRKASKFLTTIY